MLKYLSNPVSSFILKINLLQCPVNKFSLIFFSLSLLSLLLRSFSVVMVQENYSLNVNKIDNTIQIVKGMLYNEKTNNEDINQKYLNHTNHEPYILINSTTSPSDTGNTTIENKSFTPPTINFTDYEYQIQLFMLDIVDLTRLSLSSTNTTLQTNFSAQTSIVDSKIEKLLRTSLTINDNTSKNVNEYTVNYTDLVNENLNILHGKYNLDILNLESKIDNFTRSFFQEYLDNLTTSLTQFESENENRNISSNNTTYKTDIQVLSSFNNNATVPIINTVEKYNIIESDIDIAKDYTVLKLNDLRTIQIDQINRQTTQNLIIFCVLALSFIGFSLFLCCVSHVFQKRYFSYFENWQETGFRGQKYDNEHLESQTKGKLSSEVKYRSKDAFCIEKSKKDSDLGSRDVDCQNQRYTQSASWTEAWSNVWLANKHYSVVSGLLFYNIFAIMLRGLFFQYFTIIHASGHDSKLVVNNFLQKIGAELNIQLSPASFTENTCLDSISMYFNIYSAILLLLLAGYLLLGYMLHVMRK